MRSEPLPGPILPTPIEIEILPEDTPVDRAYIGLFLAINAVSAADYAARAREHGEHRDRWLDWRLHLGQHPAPDDRRGAAILSGEITVEQALMGNGQWENMIDDTVAMLGRGADMGVAALRKSIVIAEILSRSTLSRPYDQRWPKHWKIRELIRAVLDLDPATSEIEVEEWMQRHGLE